MTKFFISWAAVATILLSGTAMAIEEAKHDVTLADTPYEVREYATSVVAEVIVNDEFGKAGSIAFRKLFKYISGENENQTQISMTAPVSQELQSKKIAMTAPVGQRSTDDGWAISFMLPASYTIDTAPKPNNTDVVLREIPAYRAAVIRYSGSWKRKKYIAKLTLLQEWMQKKELKPLGEPVFARYNAPLVPWFLRRNEIIIAVSP